MKNFIQKLLMLSLLIFLSVQITCAQKVDTAARNRSNALFDLYMQRHKVLKTIAWVSLSTGTALVVIGTAQATSSSILSSSYAAGATAVAAGVIMMLGSIPCFLVASSMENKALRVQLNAGSISGIPRSEYVGLSLKIHL